jgi:hypothetical protein
MHPERLLELRERGQQQEEIGAHCKAGMGMHLKEISTLKIV